MIDCSEYLVIRIGTYNILRFSPATLGLIFPSLSPRNYTVHIPAYRLSELGPT